MESSNSVIHFTSNQKILFKILDDLFFKPSYCKEEIAIQLQNENSIISLGVPEVSFCDIPFSRILAHVKKYGGYGIALKKSWAIQKGLSPIIYLEKQSRLAATVTKNEYLISSLLANGDLEEFANNKTKKLQQEFIRFLAFIKNYSNDLKRKNKIERDYRFYDEREWRYVPANLEIKVLQNIDFLDKEILNNNISDRNNLNFTNDDINYVILKTKKGIKSLFKKFNNRIDNLASKIITIEQLKEF